MFNNKKIVSIIGARAGSKGLPGKNILNFQEKPLINWSVEASLKSKYIDQTIISTDCQEIADVAMSAGGSVPFMRPPELATDEASIMDVIHYTLNKYKDETNHSFDYILLLQPTSPLRSTVHIDEAIEQYFNTKTEDEETLVSVYTASPKTGWLMEDNEGYIKFCFDSAKSSKRRQNLGTLYLPNGAIYFSPISSLKDSFYTEKTQYFVMGKEESVDIDTFEDLQKAHFYYKRSKGQDISF